jgi:hypothetical protein
VAASLSSCGTPGWPCTWPVLYPADCAALGSDADPSPDRARYEQMAAEFLWNWTGRSYGLCPVLLRPCRKDCPASDTYWGLGPYTVGSSSFSGGAGWSPALLDGHWMNVGCGVCGDDCACIGGTPALSLPPSVHAITEVRIDGAALAASAYRVDNHALLVRLDGNAWPTCQNMAADPRSAANTFQVDYTRGVPVPLGGQVAAGALACELAKAATGDKTCALPQRVQTIARQGVTMTMLDTFEDVERGRTGIWIVDSWVASVTQPRRGGSVRSVDIPRPRSRVTTWP